MPCKCKNKLIPLLRPQTDGTEQVSERAMSDDIIMLTTLTPP